MMICLFHCWEVAQRQEHPRFSRPGAALYQRARPRLHEAAGFVAVSDFAGSIAALGRPKMADACVDDTCRPEVGHWLFSRRRAPSFDGKFAFR